MLELRDRDGLVSVVPVDALPREAPSEPGEAEDPFLHPTFLAAAVHQGPGRGRALVLLDGAARWGVVERTLPGFQVALAFAAPRVVSDAVREDAWRRLLSALADRGAHLLRMGLHASVRLSDADLAAIRRAASARGWRVESTEFGTFVLDLAAPEGELWKAVSAGHRQAIRAAERAGVTVERSESAHALEECLALIDATYARQGVAPPPRPYLERLVEDPARFPAYFARDRNGRAVATVIVALRDGTGIYLHGGSGDRAEKGAGNLLHWRVAQDLAARGFARYDLGGVELTPASGKQDGIRRFKERFGGALERHSTVDVAFSPARAQLLALGLRAYRRAAALRPTSRAPSER